MSPNSKLRFFLFLGSVLTFHLSYLAVAQVGDLVHTPVPVTEGVDNDAVLGMNLFYLVLQTILFVVISIASFSVTAQILINQKGGKVRFDLVDLNEKIIIRDRYVVHQVLMRNGLYFLYFLFALFVFLDICLTFLTALKVSPDIQIVVLISLRLLGFWFAVWGVLARSGMQRLVARPRARGRGISDQQEMR